MEKTMEKAMEKTRWALSKASKLIMAADMRSPQEKLAELLRDPDEEVRLLAARNPGVRPEDMMKFLREYPEQKNVSVSAFLLWQWMQANPDTSVK